MGYGEIIDFGSMEPWEIIPMEFDFSEQYSCFTDTTPDTIASYAFGVYDSGDDPSTPTLLTAYVYKTDFLPEGKAKCWVGNMAMPEGTYRIRCRIVTASGSRYEEEGEFIVKEY
jgi:hypothetical protein